MNKTSKFIAAATAITVAASVAPNVSAAKFSDLQNNAYADEINALVDLKVVGGYPDGTFRPNQSLTRSDVVKLLAKYLVSLGHKIPTDYKTNMRFKDLTPKSSDELLQSAALVKDVGVFIGSDGNLMHRDEIRKDQMATVLVRAFKVINNFDYIAHVKGQGFKSDLTDLNRTTVEHQEAIAVLDFYNMPKQSTFEPKTATKRGEFAYYLYRLLKVETKEPEKKPEKEPEKPVLTVKQVEVQAADKLNVILSDNKAYTVTLPKALEENIETEVAFKIDDVEYKSKVTYVVKELKVASVTGINAGQFAIKFNQPINVTTTLNEADINKLLVATGIDKTGAVSFLKGELSDDKRTLTATVKGTTSLEGRYRIVVENIQSTTGQNVVKYDDIATVAKDQVSPTVSKVENISATKVKVKFSEPVVNPVGIATFKLSNGTIITGVTGKVEANSTEVIFDFTNAYANNALLTPGSSIDITFGSIIDLANNISSPNPLKTTATLGNRDGVAPTLLNTEQLGAKKFKLTFSEEVRNLTVADIVLSQNGYSPGITSIEQDEKNPTSYIVTTINTLNGYTTITTATGRSITDLSGETNTFSTAYNFVVDAVKPSVTSAKVVTEKGKEYLEFTFDRAVEVTNVSRVSLVGDYIEGGIARPIPNTLNAQPVKHETNSNVIRVPLGSLLSGVDRAGAAYRTTATFANIVSDYGQPVNYYNNVNFTRSVDTAYNENKISVYRVETMATSSNVVADNQTVLVTFSEPVDATAGLDLTNYTLDGALAKSVNFKAGTNQQQVELKIHENLASTAFSSSITIQNMRAVGSTMFMDAYRGIVHFNENIRPTIDRAIQVNFEDQITLSFSEPVQNVTNNSFIVKVNQQPVAVNGVEMSSNNQVRIRLNLKLLAGQAVTIELAPNTAITDTAKNALQFTPLNFTYQTNITTYSSY